MASKVDAGEAAARDIVKVRADGNCEMAIPNVCTGKHESIHHRRKRRYVDTRWQPSNLIAACGDGTRGCHGYVESHPAWAMTQGLWLKEGEDPHLISVHMRWGHQRSWWLLYDEGLLEWDESDFEDIVYATGDGLRFSSASES